MQKIYSFIMDKKTVLQMLQTDFARFHQESLEISKTIQDIKVDTKNYIEALISQIVSGSTPLLAKTPKILKKKGTRIKAIPENDEMENDCSLSNTRGSRSSRVDTMILETSDLRSGRSKRGASVKAADIIKKQQSSTLNTKLRRPSEDIPLLANKIVKESRSKRPKEELLSSEDEDIRPSKQSKTEKKRSQLKNKTHNESHEINRDSTQFSQENQIMNTGNQKRTSVKRKFGEQNEDVNATLTSEQSVKQNYFTNYEPATKKANYSQSLSQKNEKDSKHMSVLERISEKSTPSSDNNPIGRTTRSSASLINVQNSKKYKMNNIINETVDMSNADETVASMYEDAIGKPIPIMNSTMNPNCTLEKMMNVTVLIEPIPTKKIMNETVTIKKNSFKEPSLYNNSTLKELPDNNSPKCELSTSAINVKNASKNKTSDLKSQKDIKIDKFNELITDDDSSPERKEYRVNKERIFNEKKRVTRSNHSLTSDDEILRTPIEVIKSNKDVKATTIKSVFKQGALFSPYAKDSVKKKVEAFEQVAMSPKQIDNEASGRVTRTKTRALAAASFSETSMPTVKQKLARKSLAKAKKISLAKHTRETDDTKENDNTYTKSAKTIRTLEKLVPKTTPLGKNRMLQMPNSVTKNQYATPSNTNTLNSYCKTTSRGNIVTHVDSFIQPLKSAQKLHDKTAEEKRRRAHDEDARRKREELLKAQAEEKRRKREEKELKNKLAREAKEKLEYEKRLKAEKEREEKAKLAQQMQEKQKEEIERKRVAQLQRAQEKEERRRQEELLRLQRLQEQEEQERQFAEQKSREQEMEKRKQAEMRQQLAEIKLRNQKDKILMQAKAKIVAQKQAPISYKIDSDPDEESDDECKPKHEIPPWASKYTRQMQLTKQQHLPMKFILKFFDAKKCTPDLRELFRGIDPKKLKRSSSAIWKTPPRYSMMNCSIIQD